MITKLLKRREKYVFVKDERLDKLDQVNLFPEKVKKAQEILSKGGYPTIRSKSEV